ncbi:MAG: hypothetical protein K2N90_11605 [Lachnospiraceae bacterium]|nr:hypothetical protein [Lachnospiraceae bacterium]
MKDIRLLIAAVCLFVGATAQFYLTFVGRGGSPAIRVLDGMLFCAGALLALRTWNKRRKINRN